MGRKTKKNYYGVLVGRDGPNVYSQWAECEEAVSGFLGACYAGFATRLEAEDWVNRWVFDNTPLQPSSSPRPHYTRSHEHISTLVEPTSSTSESTADGQGRNVTGKPMSTRREEESVESSRLEIELSSEQRHVLDLVKRGKGVFFTGSAGTGKSALLRKIIETLGGPSPSVAVIASTGIAAVNIGGARLHSFAGIGLGKETVDLLIDKIQHGKLFDTLESIARTFRDKDVPFGGIQLVISGDFCQLPPVPDHLDGVSLPIKVAFEADSWQECVGLPIILEKVYRQEDKEFVRMLNQMRYGKIEEDDEEHFLVLKRSLIYDDGIEPTELFPLRLEVESANAARLSTLPGPSHTYAAYDVPGTECRGNTLTLQQAEKLLERCLVALKKVTLKVGAQVMFIKNLSQGVLINGLLGKVIAFKSVSQALSDHNEFTVPEGTQINEFKAGYVKFGSPNMDKIADRGRVWPLVRFTNDREVLCIPVTFDVVNARGNFEAKREQIPLILAWAMSVHKSQGQTLDRVKVDLARTFEKGQAYVAVSRARTMETLQVLHFHRSKVMAHPRVLEWHEQLMHDIRKLEEAAVVQEMDNEDAIRAVFEDDNMI